MLIDEALAYRGRFSEQGLDESLLHLDKAIVVKAQNVADYFYEQVSDPWDTHKDFPNIAPPMPFLWVEWKLSKARPVADGRSVAGTTFGVLLQAMDLKDEKSAPIENLDPAFRWKCAGLIFHQSNVPVWSGTVHWYVSERGEFLLRGNELEFNFNEKVVEKLDKRAFAFTLKAQLNVPFLTLTFMHCKNVKVTPSEKWPEKLQQSRVKKGKSPLLRWHTLAIDPIKKIVASENSGNPALTPKSLHICRGHFKDFSEKGLFGKYPGIYWIPMHTRGSVETGVVGKDYLVKPDTKEEASEASENLA